MARTEYTVPQSMEEAKRREQELVAKIADIQEQLTGNVMNDPQADWHRRAETAKRLAGVDLKRVREWIRENVPSPQAEAKMKKQEATDLLWSSFRLLDTLKKRGTVFEGEELDLLKRLREFFEFTKENAFKAALACRHGSFSEVADRGALIVAVTKDPKDLEVLHKNWLAAVKTFPIVSADGQNEMVIKSAFALVKGYLCLNQVRDAEGVARSMRSNDAAVVRAWIAIYDHTKDLAYLQLAREEVVSTMITVDTEAFARCLIFEKSGALSDLKMAKQAIDKCLGVLDENRVARQRSLLFKAYLTWGLINEAHTLLSSITQPKSRLFDLCHLVEVQPTPSNLQLVLQFIATQELERPAHMTAVMSACIAVGQLDTARTVAEACVNTNGLQCLGFARLASEPKNPKKEEDLRRAEQVSVTMGSVDHSRRSYAQLQLVKALISMGRIDDAAQLAAIIPHLSLRCEACLLVHTA